MWAPADLFGPGLSALLFDLKAIASYLYEHLMVLAALILAAAGLIALATILGGRRRNA